MEYAFFKSKVQLNCEDIMSLSFLGHINFHFYHLLLVCQTFLFFLNKSWQLLFCQNNISFLLGFRICCTSITVSFYNFSNIFFVFGYVSFSFLIQFCSLFFLNKPYRKFICFVIFFQRTARRKYLSFFIYICLMSFSFLFHNFYILFCFELCSLLMKKFVVINDYLDTAFAVFYRS